MIIGDSLAQGCQSLTVKGRDSWCSVAGESAPAHTGWRFITPDFPIPVLFDLEDEINRSANRHALIPARRFEGFFGRLRENLIAWLTGTQTSSFACFDNLGLSGCTIDDLYTRTARSSAAEIASLAPAGASIDLLTDFGGGRIGDLHRRSVASGPRAGLCSRPKVRWPWILSAKAWSARTTCRCSVVAMCGG